jgi:hypothetical protein
MNERLARARDYIFRNARLVERFHFACLFEGANANTVVEALSPYQNPDGGFGNALEPDMRGPHSQPMHVDMALRILDDVGECNGEMVSRALDWLQSIAAPDGGIPWALGSVAEYPSAPWWQGSDPGVGSVGATGSILHMVLKNGLDHALVEPALAFLRGRMAELSDADLEFHMLRPAGEALKLSANDEVFERLAGVVRERNLVDPPEKGRAEPYAHTPLHWAPRASSTWRAVMSEEEIEADLVELAGRQEEDGSWPLGFPLTSPAAEYEWKGAFTIEALATLQSYGRLT